MPGDAIEPCAPSEVPPDLRVELHRLMLLQRLCEERIMALYRQGRIVGSVYTGYLQEGVAAAGGLALGPDDVVAPINREMACHFARGVPVGEVLAHFLGRATGPTQGRDGNMHFGYRQRDVFPLVSMLGDLIPVTVGAALAFKRRGEPRVAMTFFGDGAFSTGDVHEGLNLAAVLRVPAVFVIQNNRYAYSTPTERQMASTDIASRVEGGWGIPCARVDGTDVLATYRVLRDAVEAARADGAPRAVEALTLRGHGHAAHDGALYVPDALRAEYQDPIDRLERRFALDGIPPEQVAAWREAAAREVEAAVAEAEAAPWPDPAGIEEGVWAQPLRPGSSGAAT